MYVLGLTGLMASGKTTVGKMIKSFGAYVINADDIVYELQQKDTEQTQQIVARLGDSVLNDDGSLSRKKLAEIAAETPDFLDFLESVFHPGVRSRMKEYIQEAKNRGYKLAVLEVPLMFETGADVLCDSVMLCLCNEADRKKRAFERDGMTEGKWALVNARRLTLEELISKSNHLIDTDKSPKETKEDVQSIVSLVL